MMKIGGWVHGDPDFGLNLRCHTRIHNAPLTAREVEVLELIAQGLSNREVGQALGITEETIKVHVRNIMDKLDADDRTEAVTLALRRGFIHLY